MPELETSQTLLLHKCKNTTVVIKGKFNAITMNECEKVNVVLDDLVSSIDVIKSKTFAFQILGNVPTIAADQCDGGTLYLSKQGLGIEIFTSKSTAFNIYLPPDDDKDDYVECPIPEQLKTTIVKGKLVTEIVEPSG